MMINGIRAVRSKRGCCVLSTSYRLWCQMPISRMESDSGSSHWPTASGSSEIGFMCSCARRTRQSPLLWFALPGFSDRSDASFCGAACILRHCLARQFPRTSANCLWAGLKLLTGGLESGGIFGPVSWI